MSHFPIINKQQSWKYKQHDNKLFLRNGEYIYTFSFPSKITSKDRMFTENKIENNMNLHQYNDLPVKERTAQIHRSHPGELYTTLHEGKKNPTFTLKHVEGDQWKVIKKSNIASDTFNVANNYANAPTGALVTKSLLGTYLADKLFNAHATGDEKASVADYALPAAITVGGAALLKNVLNPLSQLPYR